MTDPYQFSYEVAPPIGAAETSVPWRGYQIAGTVTVASEPERRTVMVIDRERPGQLTTALAAADGSYSFRFLRPEQHIVLALDWPGEKGAGMNAAISDQVSPVAMEE